jgi:hypothetical protein
MAANVDLRSELKGQFHQFIGELTQSFGSRFADFKLRADVETESVHDFSPGFVVPERANHLLAISSIPDLALNSTAFAPEPGEQPPGYTEAGMPCGNASQQRNPSVSPTLSQIVQNGDAMPTPCIYVVIGR